MILAVVIIGNLDPQRFKDARVLITGITGFVGPHLTKSLLDEGAIVYGLVRRRSDGNLRRGLSEVGVDKQVEVIEGSVEDLTSLLSALDKSEPEYIFHLAAQSFVERSFINPLETFQTNAVGTTNLLEAIRIKDKMNSRFVFAGSSEEYGMVVSSQKQLSAYLAKGKTVFPQPKSIPELPVSETNPLRPMSPYAVTKVYGEYATLNYHRSYGLNSLVTRAFNHEGARRGGMFVTSVIAKQVMQYKYDEIKAIKLGNVNAFRDWSHIDDIVIGYKQAALKGSKGEVTNLGSERTNSVLTYLLWSIEEAGYEIKELRTVTHDKKIAQPAEKLELSKFGMRFEGSLIDEMMLSEEIEFDMRDKGLDIITNKGTIHTRFDEERFRPADVPLLMSDSSKAKKTFGFSATHSLRDIIRDQLNFWAEPKRRH